MRYFFKFAKDGSVINWQIAETEETAAKLVAAGYIEVTHTRYVQRWRVRDQYQVAALIPPSLNERTV